MEEAIKFDVFKTNTTNAYPLIPIKESGTHSNNTIVATLEGDQGDQPIPIEFGRLY